jgi:hypothetical protein
MRLALLGGGTIARMVLENLRRGALPSIEVVALTGRATGSRAASLAREYGIDYVLGAQALCAARPDVVLEAASHDAVRSHLVPVLAAGSSVIVLSAGALVDDALRAEAEAASRRSGALLYVPSGGIGGLDALKGACAAGEVEVSIQVAKPPAAWKTISFVESLGVDRARRGCAFSPKRQYRSRAGAGRGRFRPHQAKGGRRPLVNAQYPYDPGFGHDGPLHDRPGERAFAGQPENRLACVLQRFGGAQGVRLPRSLRHLTGAAHGPSPNSLD